MRFRSAALVAALGATLTVFFAAPANAQYPPCRQGGGEVSSSSATPGSTLVFTGDGFAPGATVEITLDDVYQKTATTDSDGTFTTRLFIAENTPEGQHTVKGRGPRGDECRRTPTPRALARFSRVPAFAGAAVAPQVVAPNMLEVSATIWVTKLLVGGVGSDGGLGGGSGVIDGDAVVPGANPATGGNARPGVDPAAQSGRGGLARTGAAAVLPMLLLGFALVVIGSASVGYSRHRRSHAS